MVRGNWQKRIEKAQARKHDTKQKKIRKDSRSIYKNLVQNHLWPLLNHFSDNIFREHAGEKRNILHLWVDSRPFSLNLDEFDDESFRKRDKRGNLDKQSSFDTGSSRHRNKSKSETSKHPRSHTTSLTGSLDHVDVEEHTPLCKEHFFIGRCSFISDRKGSKRATCPYVHFSKASMQQTLVDVLCPPGKDGTKPFGNDGSKAAGKLSAEVALNAASLAAAAAFAKSEGSNEEFDTDHSPVHMVYHLPISLRPFTKHESDNHEGNMKISQFLQKELALENCATSSIVYVVFNGILVFDRYNGGILVDKECDSKIFATGESCKIMKNDAKTGSGAVSNFRVNSLPGSILEIILTFLPDEACGVLPMVCKAFHQEIRALPSLWKYLLCRKCWPIPEESQRDRCRDLFLSHYKVFRNVFYLTKGVQRLRDSHNCDKVAVMKHRRLPVCSRPWNDTSIISADRYDCTLRIFESVRIRTKLACKEIISARVAPFPNSRKILCSLVSMDLDDIYITCYFETFKQGESHPNTWLVVVKRNDFLCHFSGANQECVDGLEKYNIKECYVANVREKWSENENIPQELDEHIISGNEFSIKLGHLEACGNGLFMSIGHVILPEDDPENLVGHVVDKVMLLFSIPLKSVVWSLSITENPEVPFDISNHFIHSCIKNRSQDTLKFHCYPSFPTMYLTRVETRSGQITCGVIDESLIVSRNKTLFPDRWESLDTSKRLALVTREHIFFVDYLHCTYNSSVRVVISSLPLRLNKCDSGRLYKDSILSLSLDGCLDIISLHYDGKDHVILQCLYKGETLERGSFIDTTKYITLVVVHITSHIVTHRFCVTAWDGEDESQLLTCVGTKNETMALFVGQEGLVMTGSVIRGLTKVAEKEYPKPSIKPSKKKKKRLSNKGGKKDGFARGQSAGG